MTPHIFYMNKCMRKIAKNMLWFQIFLKWNKKSLNWQIAENFTPVCRRMIQLKARNLSSNITWNVNRKYFLRCRSLSMNSPNYLITLVKMQMLWFYQDKIIFPLLRQGGTIDIGHFVMHTRTIKSYSNSYFNCNIRPSYIQTFKKEIILSHNILSSFQS